MCKFNKTLHCLSTRTRFNDTFRRAVVAWWLVRAGFRIGQSRLKHQPRRCVVLLGKTLFTVPLFTQSYKWVPANLLMGVTLRWFSILSRAECKYFRSLHGIETRISVGLMGRRTQKLTFFSCFNRFCLKTKFCLYFWLFWTLHEKFYLYIKIADLHRRFSKALERFE